MSILLKSSSESKRSTETKDACIFFSAVNSSFFCTFAFAFLSSFCFLLLNLLSLFFSLVLKRDLFAFTPSSDNSCSFLFSMFVSFCFCCSTFSSSSILFSSSVLLSSEDTSVSSSVTQSSLLTSSLSSCTSIH